jgi:hypothetical protein
MKNIATAQMWQAEAKIASDFQERVLSWDIPQNVSDWQIVLRPSERLNQPKIRLLKTRNKAILRILPGYSYPENMRLKLLQMNYESLMTSAEVRYNIVSRVKHYGMKMNYYGWQEVNLPKFVP